MSNLKDLQKLSLSHKSICLINKIKNITNSLTENEIESLLRLNETELKKILLNNKTKEKNTEIIIKNQIDYAKSRSMAIKKLYEGYDLIRSNEVCKILSISRQALSKSVKNGKIISLRINQKEGLYPTFQFKKNKVIPQIKTIIHETKVDTTDEDSVNMLLGFLLKKIDFSKTGDPQNIKHNYELIENEKALKVIINDFNRIGSI